MIELHAGLPRTDKILLDVDLKLDKSTSDKQRILHPDPKFSSLLSKKNVISVGVPEVWNLIKLLEARQSSIPAEIKLSVDKYEFYQIRFVCTFKPDKECKFIWATFSLELNPAGIRSKIKNKLPVIYDMFPREIYQEVKVSRGFTIGPNLNYSFVGLEAKLNRGQEFIKYDPEIASFGLMQPHAGWEFRKSKAKDRIMGDKELFLILRTPKDIKIEATFNVSAEIHTSWGILPIFPARKYQGQLLHNHIEMYDEE